ncbi:Carbon catabolite repressor protein 4-like protein 6 [Forsythia ovata]|uniref:Carbon catabolite repressor protein 4-like protein 6 n=1 Tax=Forsythia ovata TaxID=205694 RepID=A0ABD1W2I5_9LAMI
MRASSSPHFLAAASSAAGTSTMSSRPYPKGCRGRGRRPYSDKPSGSDSQFVSGDSHFQSVHDTNQGFRPADFSKFPSPRQPNYGTVPPQSQYGSGQQFYGLRPQFSRPTPQQPYRPPPQFRPVAPPFGHDQKFRPQQQQFRPRAPKPADYRSWEFAKPGPSPHCERFTVLSYNILADYLATNHWSKLYFHIPRHILDWSWRKKNIIFELGLWSADILCLQEVDRFQDMDAELMPRGYNGIWKMRTGDPVDGCAIFWRVSRFKLLHEESIEFNKLGLRDNVAQICVFESLNQQKNSNPLAISASPANANRVVVCNIHVLFNPKRGEIKLGQIRVLLGRAHVVSKIWDGAPIVVCGDFNCTPKSPLYNFIIEQKMDLSELPRDKVSGQASAEIHLSRPSYAIYRPETADDSAQVSAVNHKEADKSDFPPVVHKLTCVSESGHGTSTGSCSTQFSADNGTTDFSISENHASGSLSSFPREGGSPICPIKDTSHEFNSANSITNNYSQVTENGHKENDGSSSSATVGLTRKYGESNLHTVSETQSTHDKNVTLSGNLSSNDISDSKSGGTFNSDVSQVEQRCDNTSPNSLEVSSSESPAVSSSLSAVNNKDDNSTSYGLNLQCELTSFNSSLDEKLESLSLNEVLNETKEDEILSEDCSSFLSELHNSGDRFPTDLNDFRRSNYGDSDEFSKEYSYNKDLHSRGDEILDDTPDVDYEVVDVEKYSYDPSAWTPMEIQTATGSADCKVMGHPLKLRSVYGEVEDSSGLRDSSGEPLVTSYHRRFLGTVDYIWRSEGLQTAKVLAPIPKHVMQWTRGFPTKDISPSDKGKGG